MTADAQTLVRRHDLTPHPEGGFFARTYTAAGMTAIHYLLPYGAISALHRLRSDELWFFHAGVPLIVVEIAPDGALTETRVEAQHLVPGGRWFGARLGPEAKPGDYAFVSCAVTPPFDYAQFELADRRTLSAAYPQHARIIAEMTR